MCAAPTLVVKNTFICVVEEEEALSPPARAGRRRASTEGAIRFGDFGGSEGSPSSREASPCCVRLAAALEAGGSRAEAALGEVAARVRELAFDEDGAQVVLRALDLAEGEGALALVAGLRGAVGEAVFCPHAHLVLRRVVQSLGAAGAGLVAAELRADPVRFVNHIYGSQVICELLERARAEGQTQAQALLEGLSQSAELKNMFCHKFGHTVVLAILQNGFPHQRSKIVMALCTDLQRFARHRFASEVMAQTLTVCLPAESRCIAYMVMSQAGAVTSLACHGFGVRVVRELLKLPGESEKVLFYVLKSARRLAKDKFGAQLLRDLGLHQQILVPVVPVVPLSACVGGA